MIEFPQTLIDIGAASRHDSDSRTGDKTWVWLSEEEKVAQRRAFQMGLSAMFQAMSNAVLHSHV
jgi:hypothetical protein